MHLKLYGWSGTKWIPWASIIPLAPRSIYTQGKAHSGDSSGCKKKSAQCNKATQCATSCWKPHLVGTLTMAQGPPNCLACECLAPYYTFAMPYAILDRWLTANEGGPLWCMATCIVPQPITAKDTYPFYYAQVSCCLHIGNLHSNCRMGPSCPTVPLPTSQS